LFSRVELQGFLLPQCSRGPIATAFPLVFILMNLGFNFSLAQITASLLTMIENSLFPYSLKSLGSSSFFPVMPLREGFVLESPFPLVTYWWLVNIDNYKWKYKITHA